MFARIWSLLLRARDVYLGDGGPSAAAAFRQASQQRSQSTSGYSE